jgi:hypothetical protein
MHPAMSVMQARFQNDIFYSFSWCYPNVFGGGRRSNPRFGRIEATQYLWKCLFATIKFLYEW